MLNFEYPLEFISHMFCVNMWIHCSRDMLCVNMLICYEIALDICYVWICWYVMSLLSRYDLCEDVDTLLSKYVDTLLSSSYRICYVWICWYIALEFISPSPLPFGLDIRLDIHGYYELERNVSTYQKLLWTREQCVNISKAPQYYYTLDAKLYNLHPTIEGAACSYITTPKYYSTLNPKLYNPIPITERQRMRRSAVTLTPRANYFSFLSKTPQYYYTPNAKLYNPNPTTEWATYPCIATLK